MRSENVFKARALLRAIREILVDEWDPIGVKDEPLAQDEYDSYTGYIAKLIIENRGDMAIAQHLQRLESQSMGLGERPLIALLPVAQKLAALSAL